MLCYERGHSRRVGAAALVLAAAQQLPDLARDDGVVGPLVVDDLGPAPGVLAQLAGADIAASSAVNCSIGFTISFHNHGEGLLLVGSAARTQFHVYLSWGQRSFSIVS